MSAKSLEEALKEIGKQLAWRGPNDKVMGHVVIKRDKAEILFNELFALLELIPMVEEAERLADAKK